MPNQLTPGGAFAVTSQWRNTGVAPTYDPWQVRLRLVDAGGTVVWSAPLGLNLRGLLPGSTSDTTRVTLPATVPGGTYTATLRVEDASGYFTRPLELAITGKQPDGSYRLGPVVIGTPG